MTGSLDVELKCINHTVGKLWTCRKGRNLEVEQPLSRGTDRGPRFLLELRN